MVATVLPSAEKASALDQPDVQGWRCSSFPVATSQARQSYPLEEIIVLPSGATAIAVTCQGCAIRRLPNRPIAPEAGALSRKAMAQTLAGRCRAPCQPII